MNNLYNYKLALKLNKDIEKILSILDTSLKQLEQYKHFSSVKACLVSIDDAKIMLTLHNQSQKRIIEKKGLIE